MGFHVCDVCFTIIRKRRAHEKKKKLYFLLADTLSRKSSVFSLSATEPNIWLNEGATDHGNVILVRACDLERSDTKREVVFGDEIRTILESSKK